MSDNNLNINDIQDKDGDWLTGILEPYADDIYDEIMLLNITKKDLSNKKDDNIQQVGYKAPYGDDDEIEGLIYYYFKKSHAVAYAHLVVVHMNLINFTN